jgi:hypothetical protein
MTLHELLAALDAGGVSLSLRLVVDAPRGVLTEELKAALLAHKPLLLARLGRTAEWEYLSTLHWGPALEDQPEAGDPDPYALAERRAIQMEDDSSDKSSCDVTDATRPSAGEPPCPPSRAAT